MHVLHLTAGNLFGGVESSLITLAKYAAGSPPHTPIFGLCYEGRLSRELTKAGAAVHFLGAVRVRWPWTLWRARRNLRVLLERLRPSCVVCHSCWPHAVFAPVVRQGGLPLVFWAHDQYRGKHWLDRWASLTKPDLILATSVFSQKFLGNIFPGVPTEVINCPVPPLSVCNQHEERSFLRKVLGTPDDHVVIVQASRLERWKGHSALLVALGRLKHVPRWSCWIVGGPQRAHESRYFSELQKQAVEQGIAARVRFLGQRSDVADLLLAADIHCQPNTGPEPFGVAFVEALYAGLPVVTTAIGGAMEIVQNDCGILVRPTDDSALADSLFSLITDESLRKRLGAGGPARALSLCEPTKQIEKYVRALSSLMST